mgnify:CR=1 FL=1
MRLLAKLPQLIGGKKVDIEEEGSARRIRLALAAAAATALASALFGVAVGCTDTGLLLGNIYKVPMVVILSALAALPAGLLAGKLMETEMDTSHIITSLASANFTGSLVLLAAAPVVALYYLTGSAFSGHIGLAAAFIAEIVAAWIFFRAANERRPEEVKKREIFLPLLVIMSIQVIALVQMIGIASPILPEVTPFSHGFDGLVAK